VPRTLPQSRLLEPSTLAAIKDLRLVARVIVEGFLAGEHLDRRPGAGIEFSQYRSYMPGDDLRHVDWRVYGRSDRFFVRESEVERDITVRLVLDATASMGHADGAMTKLEYGRLLLAAVAYLADHQGDRVSFHAVRDGGSVDLPAQRGRRSLPRVLHALSTVEASGVWPSWEVLGHHLTTAREREVVVLVSDLYDAEARLRQALRTLQALGHEVLVLHLMGRNELEFAYEGDLAFEDLESGATVRGNADVMRGAYIERMRHELEEWRAELLGLGVAYELMPIDLPVDQALRRFLLGRRRLP
jgi:uncharacterized protein (DUF58 family)